ncbi:MAG: hypothetical protein FK732_02680, partial [Asgard group archaeon]|nr:hypothetical protein [Asgard group archaeon]
MAQNLKESQSLGYILKQWFNKTLEFQTLFLKYYQSFQIESQDGILSNSSELQKFLGKAKTKQSDILKKQLLESLINIELDTIELREYLIRYKTHLEKLQSYKLVFQSQNRIKEHVLNNIETINSLSIMQNNLAKSVN